MRNLPRISITLSLFAFLTAWAPAQVRVLSAVWGADGRYDNVTRRVQDLANSGRYSFEADTDTLRSDPAKGKRKAFRVQYQTRAGTFTDSVREGDRFSFRGIAGGWGGGRPDFDDGYDGKRPGQGNWGCWNPWYPGAWPGARYVTFTIENASGKFVAVYHTDRFGSWRFVREIKDDDDKEFRSPVGENWLVLGYRNQTVARFRAAPGMDKIKIK